MIMFIVHYGWGNNPSRRFSILCTLYSTCLLQIRIGAVPRCRSLSRCNKFVVSNKSEHCIQPGLSADKLGEWVIINVGGLSDIYKQKRVEYDWNWHWQLVDQKITIWGIIVTTINTRPLPLAGTATTTRQLSFNALDERLPYKLLSQAYLILSCGGGEEEARWSSPSTWPRTLRRNGGSST